MKKHVVKVMQPNLSDRNHRRQFLKLGGMAVIGSGILLACSREDVAVMKDSENPANNPDPQPGSGSIFDLGEGDLGVLNYAYALEQLEADFYTKVVNSFYANISDEEMRVLTALYNHEVNHREFFKVAINAAVGDNTELVLPTLEFDYGNLDFNSREQILNVAKTLEDTGVAAYNGAGRLLTNPDYLVIAGKIVSVEARHAAAIRTLINPGSADFAGDDVVTVDTGLDQALNPSVVLGAVGNLGYIQTQFTANYLP